MIEVQKKINYEAFGLNVFSEYPLPELPQYIGKKETADVVIEIGDLSLLWNDLDAKPERYLMVGNSLIFQIPSVATFYIQEGKKITVSPLMGSDEDEIRLYILGTCMGAILMQRRVLPLHGSAVAVDGKAYAFIGDSGVGKSTLASAFLENGYELISDDLIPVSISSDNIPFIFPAYPQQKLWQESLDEFGKESSKYRHVYKRETKYAIPVRSKFAKVSLPLSGIFELVKTEGENIEIHPINGLERLLMLNLNTYRNTLIARLGLTDWHFNTITGIAKQVETFQLKRPNSRFTAYQLVERILLQLKKGK
ncbi:aldolase [Bacillus sp. T3]|uniref:aldolase n=1 Tax=Bacillus sp. T3 TaxID=467262 RepID=UPI002980D9B3|nr:aldolase [Bacillus sp. T3]